MRHRRSPYDVQPLPARLSPRPLLCLPFRTLVVANVGDSRAVAAERVNGKIVAQDLSVDQTPYRCAAVWYLVWCSVLGASGAVRPDALQVRGCVAWYTE